MTSRKARRKAKKHNDALRDEAWSSVERGRLERGLILMQRALDKAPSNARYWLDLGLIQDIGGRHEEAIRSVRQALELSPTYAAASRELERLMGSADRARASETVEALETAADVRADRTSRYDWRWVEETLTQKGCVHLPEVLTETECGSLIELDAEPRHFEHEVTLSGGNAVYRFFGRPLPPLVQELRAEFYWRLAPIVNRWSELLEREERFPLLLDRFLAHCHEHGQRKTTPLLFRYERGSFNDFHQDVSGAVFFPFQLAVTLGPGNAADGGGGEFVLADRRGGKRKKERVIRAGIGDAVVFCTRERLQEIGGIHGLQPVVHGVRPLLARRRYALGVPFHEYR